MKFRKKPVVIEAMQFVKPDDFNDIYRWGLSTNPNIGRVMFESRKNKTMAINTLEGMHTAQLGDWIIRGVKGEFYPCKPDIFEATYEPAPKQESGDK